MTHCLLFTKKIFRNTSWGAPLGIYQLSKRSLLRTVHRWQDRPPLPQTLCSLRFQRAFCCNKEKRTFILEKCRTLFICNISTNASSLLSILLDILDWKLTLTSHTYFESPPLRKRRGLLQGIPSAWANITANIGPLLGPIFAVIEIFPHTVLVNTAGQCFPQRKRVFLGVAEAIVG